MDRYDVALFNAGDSDTEMLFRGDEADCKIFMAGYLLAMRIHTSYSANTIEDGTVVLLSPLVSCDTLKIYIIKVPDDVA